MIKSPKAKGSLFEREIARILRESGIEESAQRQPMSGASSFLPGDIHSKRFTFECKSYAKMSIYKILEQCKRSSTPNRPAILALKANNKPTLIAMEIDTWLELVAYADKGGYREK